jgi:hypothetical protein
MTGIPSTTVQRKHAQQGGLAKLSVCFAACSLHAVVLVQHHSSK